MPAGVCQTAEDRCDHDPQLAALNWLTEVTGTKIGRWPVAEVPVKMSESPAYIGGRLDRGAPCYGEDNHYVYGELLGMSSQEIKALAEEGVIEAHAHACESIGGSGGKVEQIGNINGLFGPGTSGTHLPAPSPVVTPPERPTAWTYAAGWGMVGPARGRADLTALNGPFFGSISRPDTVQVLPHGRSRKSSATGAATGVCSHPGMDEVVSEERQTGGERW